MDTAHKPIGVAQAEEDHDYAEAERYDEAVEAAAVAETHNAAGEGVDVHDVDHTKDDVHAHVDVAAVEAHAAKDAGNEMEVVEVGVDAGNAVGEEEDVVRAVCVLLVDVVVDVGAARMYDFDNVHRDVHTPEQAQVAGQM
jgi:hypothetical protein